jgi:hypothetical protein
MKFDVLAVMLCAPIITLMMETLGLPTSETSIYFKKAILRYIAKSCHLHNRHHENQGTSFTVRNQSN